MNEPDVQSALKFFNLNSLDGLTIDQIKSKYHILAKKYHPDVGGSSQDFIFLRKCYVLLKKVVSDPFFKTSDQNNENKTGYDNYQNVTDFTDINQELLFYKSGYFEYKKIYEKNLENLKMYEDFINNQIFIINQNNQVINSLSDIYNQQVKQAQEELNKKIQILDKAKSVSLKNLVFGRISNETYLNQKNQAILEYNQKLVQAENKYTEDIIKAYNVLIKKMINQINNL